MIKKLFGAALITGVAALGAKVISDILKADEEELIELQNEPEEQEDTVEQQQPEE